MKAKLLNLYNSSLGSPQQPSALQELTTIHFPAKLAYNIVKMNKDIERHLNDFQDTWKKRATELEVTGKDSVNIPILDKELGELLQEEVEIYTVDMTIKDIENAEVPGGLQDNRKYGIITPRTLNMLMDWLIKDEPETGNA